MKTLEQLDTTDAETWVRTRFGVLRGHPAWRSLIDAFNAGQVHARAACRAAVLEEAAQIADEEAALFGGVAAGPMATDRGKLVHEAMAAGAKNAAAAIR